MASQAAVQKAFQDTLDKTISEEMQVRPFTLMPNRALHYPVPFDFRTLNGILCAQKSVESSLRGEQSTTKMLRMLIEQADETQKKSLHLQADIKRLKTDIDAGRMPVSGKTTRRVKSKATGKPLGRIRALSVVSSALVNGLLRLVKKIWPTTSPNTPNKPSLDQKESKPRVRGETSYLRSLVMNVVALMLTMSLLNRFVKADAFEEVGSFVKNYATLICMPTPDSWDKERERESYSSGPD
jgi:hypothetical protein